MEERYASQSRTLSDLEAAHSALRRQHSELEQAHSRLQGQHAGEVRRCEALKAECAQLREACAEVGANCAKHEAECARLWEKQRDAASRCSALERECAQLRAAHAAAAAECDGLTEQLASLREQHQGLTSRYDALQEVSRGSAGRDADAAVAAQLAPALQQVAQLQQALEEEQAECGGLRKRLVAAESKAKLAASHERALSSATSELSAAKKALDEADADAAAARVELGSVRHELLAVGKELAAARGQARASQAAAEAAAREVEGAKREAAAAVAEVGDVRAEQAATAQRAHVLEAQCKQLEAECMRMAGELGERDTPQGVQGGGFVHPNVNAPPPDTSTISTDTSTDSKSDSSHPHQAAGVGDGARGGALESSPTAAAVAARPPLLVVPASPGSSAPALAPAPKAAPAPAPAPGFGLPQPVPAKGSTLSVPAPASLTAGHQGAAGSQRTPLLTPQTPHATGLASTPGVAPGQDMHEAVGSSGDGNSDEVDGDSLGSSVDEVEDEVEEEEGLAAFGAPTPSSPMYTHYVESHIQGSDNDQPLQPHTLPDHPGKGQQGQQGRPPLAGARGRRRDGEAAGPGGGGHHGGGTSFTLASPRDADADDSSDGESPKMWHVKQHPEGAPRLPPGPVGGGGVVGLASGRAARWSGSAGGGRESETGLSEESSLSVGGWRGTVEPGSTHTGSRDEAEAEIHPASRADVRADARTDTTAGGSSTRAGADTNADTNTNAVSSTTHAVDGKHAVGVSDAGCAAAPRTASGPGARVIAGLAGWADMPDGGRSLSHSSLDMSSSTDRLAALPPPSGAADAGSLPPLRGGRVQPLLPRLSLGGLAGPEPADTPPALRPRSVSQGNAASPHQDLPSRSSSSTGHGGSRDGDSGGAEGGSGAGDSSMWASAGTSAGARSVLYVDGPGASGDLSVSLSTSLGSPWGLKPLRTNLHPQHGGRNSSSNGEDNSPTGQEGGANPADDTTTSHPPPHHGSASPPPPSPPIPVSGSSQGVDSAAGTGGEGDGLYAYSPSPRAVGSPGLLSPAGPRDPMHQPRPWAPAPHDAAGAGGPQGQGGEPAGHRTRTSLGAVSSRGSVGSRRSLRLPGEGSSELEYSDMGLTDFDEGEIEEEELAQGHEECVGGGSGGDGSGSGGEGKGEGGVPAWLLEQDALLREIDSFG